MTSTYTPDLRLTLQGNNDNPNTWGTIVNQQIVNLIEEAVCGVTQVDCTGTLDIDLSLVTANGATDVPRHAVLELTGLIGANISVLLPAVQKVYFIRAAYTAVSGQTVSIKCKGGSTTINFPIGQSLLLYTNGTVLYSINTGGLSAVNNLSDLTDAVVARQNLGTRIGTDVQAYDAGLLALAAFNTNGILVQTAPDTFAGRTIAAGSTSLTVTNGDGVLGSPVLNLAAATTSLSGGVILADTATTKAGSDAAKALTPAGLKGALLVSNSYESAQQAVVVSTIINLTHALGAVPKLVTGELVCVTTNLNYAVNDVVPFAFATSNSSIALYYNSTNIGVIIPASITIPNKTTRTLTAITAADWKIVIRAWA